MSMKIPVCAAVFLVLAALLFYGVFSAVDWAMPIYRESVADDNYTEKMTGLYLLKQSAARDDLIIYGSSELRTLEINTHPVNFFSGNRSGFQPNIIGRGSCQALTHAMSIAASGDALTGKKVVLITSPQSFVPDGFAPDLFMANFSPQQYLELMEADDISPEIKQAVSARVSELHSRYEALHDNAGTDPAIRYLAEHNARPTLATTARNAVLTPYYAFSRYLRNLNDRYSSGLLLWSVPIGSKVTKEAPTPNSGIDWDAEERVAVAQAREMTTNNEFGILNDYYTTYIGTRLNRQRDMDSNLSYSVSEEYGDLRILFEVCHQKGVEPLFVHVPLHGQWSDYTGFTAERRHEYYQNVRDIADEYGILVLDLTGYEYEEFFLCDIMHLGWKGWLEFDKAVIEYYHGD